MRIYGVCSNVQELIFLAKEWIVNSFERIIPAGQGPDLRYQSKPPVDWRDVGDGGVHRTDRRRCPVVR